MKIGIYDVDSTIPNLALMKISAYYKNKGHDVEMYNPLFIDIYDKIYASKVFSFSDGSLLDPERMEIGGTGYDMFKKLPDKIEVLVHPQCLIHSLVVTRDFRSFVSMFRPDMKVPIGFSLYYPEVPPISDILDFRRIKNLEFERPNLKKFPALKLALDVAYRGGSLPAVLVSSARSLQNLWVLMFLLLHGVLVLTGWPCSSLV